MKDQAEELRPGLYVVATPIGNLEDITFRALRTLRGVDWIAAEDTRESRKLLDHYEIKARLYALHEHSTRSKVEELVGSLHGGGRGAYISDAGSPGLCDPGADLVNACVKVGVEIFPIPGASALVTLLSVSGIEESHFCFQGFFPREKKEREAWAARAEGIGGPQLFYESPHRIKGALAFLAERFPEAGLVVGRELTKRFETITRGNCASVERELGALEPRGEYALALCLPEAQPAESSLKPEALRELVKDLTELGAGQKVLVKVAMSHGMRKNEAYRLALELLEK